MADGATAAEDAPTSSTTPAVETPELASAGEGVSPAAMAAAAPSAPSAAPREGTAPSAPLDPPSAPASAIPSSPPAAPASAIPSSPPAAPASAVPSSPPAAPASAVPSSPSAAPASAVPSSPSAAPASGVVAAGSSVSPSSPPGDSSVPALSKRQQKKLARRAKWQEHRQERRHAEKASRAQLKEQRRAETEARIASMSPEELQAMRETQRALRRNRKAADDARRARLRASVEEGVRVVIDLGFSDKMSDGELRSMCNQVTYCYHANGQCAVPAHLMITDLDASTPMGRAMAFHCHGMDRWHVTRSDLPLEGLFEGRREELVYLTADSPNELTTLDPTKAYVVGGIVDRNRYKRLCYDKAVALGIETARLPIGDYVQLAASPVMCTNHVVDLLLSYLDTKDWKKAFETAVPTRKRARGEGGDGEEEEEEEGEEKRDQAAEGKHEQEKHKRQEEPEKLAHPQKLEEPEKESHGYDQTMKSEQEQAGHAGLEMETAEGQERDASAAPDEVPQTATGEDETKDAENTATA